MIETPGHAPSHVCLHQPEQRVLLTGDHLMGRVSQYFDVGYTPDPVGEFLDSLTVIERLDARLALAGHARPFTDIQAHIDANRREVEARVNATRAALADGPKSAYEAARAVYGEAFNAAMASWLITLTRAWLVASAAVGRGPQRWWRSRGALERSPRRLGAMRIDERIASGTEPAFSFEFFPPKTEEGEANLFAALAELARLDPTFVSVTYGAGGTPAQRGKTIDIVSRIKADHGLEAMAHFTCVGATVDELRACWTACATPGSRTCSPCAATRPRAWTRRSGRRPTAACATPAS